MSPVTLLITASVALILCITFITLSILYCRSLYKTMQHVPHENRIFPSAFIWLTLIPWVGIVFAWMMIPFGIPGGLKNTLAANVDAVRDVKALKIMGIASQILMTLACFSDFFIPVHFFQHMSALPMITGVVWVVPASVVWILYWVKIVAFRKKYFDMPACTP